MPTSNTLNPSARPHTTHYACGERLQEYGSICVGCCCTLHACQTDAGALSWMQKPETAPVEEHDLVDGTGKKVGTALAPLQLEDFEGEANPKAALRANVRNAFLEMHSAITDGISSLHESYQEAIEALDLQPDDAVAAALSDMAVAAQRVVDKVENQLNEQMRREQTK